MILDNPAACAMPRKRTAFALLTLCAAASSSLACEPQKPSELDKLRRVPLKIKEQAFDLWVAEADSVRVRGLMFVTAEQMAPTDKGVERGMIFVFPHAQQTSFWMKNTIIPLDIAYLTSDGEIVSIFTMAPLDDRHGRYQPARPYRYALEVRGGKLRELGLKPGDKITLPPELLKK